MDASLVVLFEIFLTLLIILDPPGVLAPYMSLTKEYNAIEKNTILKQAIGFSAIVLIGTLFIGHAILGALGISTFALKIAGGILLMKFGYETMTDSMVTKSVPGESPSFAPLGFPMISGPGSITAVILISERDYSDVIFIHKYLFIVPIIVIALFVMYLVLRSSDKIKSVIGEKSLGAIVKIVGLLILTIGIQLIFLGIQNWIIEF
ncbi:MAG: MarC family protein [Candidatus Heimdallarchaeota archaeon]|nr:MarC family protein [Candidatus Heimdallarchaeota archaeon]